MSKWKNGKQKTSDDDLAKTNKQIEKAKKPKEPKFWHWLNLANTKAAIEDYDGNYSKRNIFSFIFITEFITVITGILFNMQIIWIAVMCLISLLFIPQLMVSSCQRKYEERRFRDVNVYIEQLLYSFLKNKQFYASLVEVRQSFLDSPMLEVIDDALLHIQTVQSDNPQLEACEIIEKKYSTEKVKTVHRFLLKAEAIGGNFEKTIELLNEDRSAWERRNAKLMEEMKQKRNEVYGSIGVTVAVCIGFVRFLPADTDISKVMVVQLGTVVLWFIDFIFLEVADKKTARSFADKKEENDDEKSIRRYERCITYDEELERKESLKWCIPFFVIAVVVFLLGHHFAAVIPLIIGVFMMYQHKIGHSLDEKNIRKEIETEFPDWLMEMALLLQTESVTGALYESYKNAPVILKPELKILNDDIMTSGDENGISIEPYLNFMAYFDIPAVNSAMKMLYAIAAGTGGDADTQIAEIIRKNNEMQDKSAEVENDNAIAGLIGLFLAPSLSAGGKICIDMVAFMVVAMGNLGQAV